jgi:arylsulfatase A-like enzyme
MKLNANSGENTSIRSRKISGFGLSALCAFASLAALADIEVDERLNVLFISVDDLRPDIGAYGVDIMHTPHLDRLAGEGRLFQRHYVQVPTCGASRYSLLTGQYPRHSLSWNNSAFELYQQGLAPVSLPQWFRDHGYYTAQTGKISHRPDGLLEDQARIAESGVDNTYNQAPHMHFSDPENPEIPGAWDLMITPVGEWGTAWGAFFAYHGGETRYRGRSPAKEGADVADAGYPDGLMGDAAVEVLTELRDREEPFFYAVGFFKPHLPFNAPKKYWDLYDRDEINISHVDPVRRTSDEMWGSYGHSAEQTKDPDYVRELIHGYYACVSYVDAQVGKLLDALDDLNLSDNTIVVLWSDHGFHLGELGYWGKHTLHEYSLHAPLIVRKPDMPDPGRPASGVVGSIDIYPTLVELAGLPMPEHLDGRSLAAAVEDSGANPAGFAVGFWRNDYTLRTDRYRLIGLGDDAQLFDHKNDPGERDDVSDRNPEVVRELRNRLETILDRRKAARTGEP